MALRRFVRAAFIGMLVVATATSRDAAAGTIVHFSTDVAAFDVELYDAAMPSTVANFLAYVNAGSYSSTIMHRSTTYDPAGIQVVQGGGYLLSENQLLPVVTNPPIALESGTATNVRGTIAMARGAATDSATSQYYFNVQDNHSLDGSYAVFGNVVGSTGLAALDALGSVPVYDASAQLGAAFGELPLLNPALDAANLVLVTSVAPVPEPAATLLAAVGLTAIAALGSRRSGAVRR